MGNIIISKLMIIIILVLIYFIVAKSFVFMLPFIFGWLISLIIEPMVILLTKKLRLYRGISSFISVIAFLVIGGLLISSLGGLIISELTKLSNPLPDVTEKTNEFILYLDQNFQSLFINISPRLASSISDTLYSIINALTGYIGVLATSTINFVTAIPNFLIFILFTLLSAFFISKDKEKIYRFISVRIPKKLYNSKNIKVLKEDLLLAIFGYIRAQLILMIITFTISSIGLSLIGANYAIPIALIVSIVDAFPVLGSGSIYIPWILIRLINGDYNTAIFLLILYLSITIVRQTLEPKILSSQIGLYPLVTLISIYVGFKIFGFIGIILGPFMVITILALQKMEILPRWKGNSEVNK